MFNKTWLERFRLCFLAWYRSRRCFAREGDFPTQSLGICCPILLPYTSLPIVAILKTWRRNVNQHQVGTQYNWGLLPLTVHLQKFEGDWWAICWYAPWLSPALCGKIVEIMLCQWRLLYQSWSVFFKLNLQFSSIFLSWSIINALLVLRNVFWHERLGKFCHIFGDPP